MLILLYQARLRIYELTGAPHLRLHGVVGRGGHEQKVYPYSQSIFDPLPFFLTMKDLGGAAEDDAHAVKDEALHHDLEAEGGEETKERPVAARVADKGVQSIQ